jgi:hypothetical protein
MFSTLSNAPLRRTVHLETRSMKTLRSILVSLVLLAVGAPGWGGGVALAHDEEDVRPGGPGYDAGYQRGYQHGYRHGYYDAVSGLDYENHAASHGLDGAGPFFEGMHEGEHVGYDAGFRAGRARSHHHHHVQDDGY